MDANRARERITEIEIRENGYRSGRVRSLTRRPRALVKVHRVRELESSRSRFTWFTASVVDGGATLRLERKVLNR